MAHVSQHGSSSDNPDLTTVDPRVEAAVEDQPDVEASVEDERDVEAAVEDQRDVEAAVEDRHDVQASVDPPISETTGYVPCRNDDKVQKVGFCFKSFSILLPKLFALVPL